MKKLLSILTVLLITTSAFAVADRPLRETGKEAGMILDLQKISLGTIANVEQKKQYLSTVQLEKQRIQNFTLRMVYENAYTLYKRGDYQRAEELANVILSIDPSMKNAQTLSNEANRMATYGTLSEGEIIKMKYEEAISLYKHGRLVEAQSKFEEILVLRPHEEEAQAWIERIDNELAAEHTRRGYYAYKNGDYQEALDQWYSVLLIKKEDADLTAKIAEVEDLLKKEKNQKTLNKAFSLYAEGKLVTAYKEFQRALEIQPGEQQTQKFIIQLKQEIANGYYNAGNKAYNAKKYNTAIANWKEAKNWGYNQGDIAVLVKNAQKAKNRAATAAAAAAAAAAKAAEKAAQPASEEEEEVSPEVDEIPETLPTTSSEDTSTELPVPLVDGSPENSGEDFPSQQLADKNIRVSEEARQASKTKYLQGLSYFNDGNYEKAKESWQAALNLNPENSSAALGLKRVEEKYSSR